MAKWTTRLQPFTSNRTPVLTAVSSADGITPVAVAVDETTGRLLTSTTGGGAGTQYQEGATTNPGTGTLSIGRYQATPPSLTDQQLWGLQLDSSGNLKVTGSLSVGGTTDNSAFTAGSSTGTPSMGFYHSTIDTVTDGRAAAVAITSKRAAHSNLRDSSGNEIGTTAAPVYTAVNDTTASGSITNTQAVTIATNGQSTVGIQVTGSFTGTLLIKGSTDGSTYSPTTAVQLSNGTIVSSVTGAFNGQANVAGLSSFQVVGSTVSVGTAVVTLRASSSVGTVMLDNPLPAGSSIVGKVGIDQTTPGTTNGVQVNAALPAGTNNIGIVTLNTESVSSQTALTTTATISGSSGRYNGGSFINLNTAPAYIQVFDTTGAVSLGSTTPTFVQPIPAASTAANGAGYAFEIAKGIAIANGIKAAATTTATGASTVSTGLTGYFLYQ